MNSVPKFSELPYDTVESLARIYTRLIAKYADVWEFEVRAWKTLRNKAWKELHRRRKQQKEAK